MLELDNSQMEALASNYTYEPHIKYIRKSYEEIFN